MKTKRKKKFAWDNHDFWATPMLSRELRFKVSLSWPEEVAQVWGFLLKIVKRFLEQVSFLEKIK